MLKTRCFNCSTTTTKRKAWTVEMNTAEGKHKVTLCETCGPEFDSLSKELIEVLDERS
jgi:hypothetical protein|tara:strand:+ start:231 stop:404 length:174 start_codon:yes stop_codon:yes gene_type:complete